MSLKEELIQQSGKHETCCLHQILNEEITFNNNEALVSTLDVLSWCYFQLDMRFQCFENHHILFLFTFHKTSQISVTGVEGKFCSTRISILKSVFHLIQHPLFYMSTVWMVYCTLFHKKYGKAHTGAQ